MAKVFAVISDVHGNYKALEAVLEYCSTHPVDGIIGLGDYVTDSPYPERTIALLKRMREEYPCYMVRGNRENYLIENYYNDKGWKPSSANGCFYYTSKHLSKEDMEFLESLEVSANGCFYYTSKHLSKEDMEFLESLPEEMQVNVEGCPKLFICHGIPGNVRGNVGFNPELKETALQNIKGNYLFGGHSHIQEVYKLEDKTYMNPGCLGYTLDGIGRHVQFAMIYGCDDEWKIELHSIPYDADSFLKDFHESGLDKLGFVLNRAVKKTIITGKNHVLECVTEVEKETGLPPHLVPEDVWEKVAKKLGV